MAKKYNNNNSEAETEMSSCCSFGRLVLVPLLLICGSYFLALVSFQGI